MDYFNRSPLHSAIQFRSSDALQLLLQHNADYTIKTKAGESLLHYAAHHGDLRTLETLRLFDLREINVQDRVASFSIHQKVKGLVGLTALQIAEQRQDVTPEWMNMFRQLVRDVKFPETRLGAHGLNDDCAHSFEDALEHQGGEASC